MSVRFTGDIIPAQYVERLSDALQGNGLYGFYTLGGAVTTSSGLTVAIADIPISTCVVNGTLNTAAYSASTLSMTAAHATLDRIDIVHVAADGTVAKTDGTPAADPIPPDITDAQLHLAQINVAATQTTLASGDITDMRQVLPRRTVTIRKTADETRTTSSTLTDDSDLVFTVPASTSWIAELHAYVTTTETPDFKFTVTWPSGATGLVTGRVAGITAVDGLVNSVNSTGPSIAAGIYDVMMKTSGTSMALGAAGTTEGEYQIELRIVVEVSTTAGTIDFQWAQNTSDAASTTVKEHSSLIAYQVI